MLHFLLAGVGSVEHTGDGPRLAPIDGEVHGADGLKMADRALVKCNEGKIVLLDKLLETCGDPVAHETGLVAGVGLLHLLEHGVAGNAAERVSGHGAAAECLMYLLRAVKACAEILHVFSLTAESACAGVAARDDLAEYGQVGRNAEVALSAVHADSECGNDFIEYKQCAVLAAKGLNALAEVLVNGSGAALGADGLEHNGSGAALESVCAELSLKVVQVAGEEFLGILEAEAGNAVSLSPLGAGDADAVAELIAPAVISAAHLEYLPFAGGKASDTDSGHAGLGARAEHTEHINIGDKVDYLLAEFVLILMEKAGGRAAGIEQLDDLLTHCGGIAAQNGGAARLQEVKVSVAVDIIEICALSLGKDEGERIVESEVVLNAAGNDLLCFLDHLLRGRALLLKILGAVILKSFRLDRIDRLLNKCVKLLSNKLSVGVIDDSVVSHFLLPPETVYLILNQVYYSTKDSVIQARVFLPFRQF